MLIFCPVPFVSIACTCPASAFYVKKNFSHGWKKRRNAF